MSNHINLVTGNIAGDATTGQYHLRKRVVQRSM
jgi:hypothetical protein